MSQRAISHMAYVNTLLSYVATWKKKEEVKKEKNMEKRKAEKRRQKGEGKEMGGKGMEDKGKEQGGEEGRWREWLKIVNYKEKRRGSGKEGT